MACGSYRHEKGGHYLLSTLGGKSVCRHPKRAKYGVTAIEETRKEKQTAGVGKKEKHKKGTRISDRKKTWSPRVRGWTGLRGKKGVVKKKEERELPSA